MERTYDVGAAKYAAKKLLKIFKRKELNNPRLENYLSTILIFAEYSGIPKLKGRVQRVVNYLMTRQGIFEDILDAVRKIEEQISKANEKRRVMEVRHNLSYNSYRKRLTELECSTCPSKLNVYDVIKVPTMGGMHYSIVSEINDEYVTCFPTTTASRKDLGLLGVKSVSLSGCGDNRFVGIRLSAARTQIAYQDAIRSYVDSVADNPQICEKLTKVLSFA